MSQLGPTFNGEAFRKDFPMVIASSRATALMQPMRVRYASSGYAAGTVMARNTVDGFYDAYVDGTASGVGTAASILFQDLAVEDFDLATSLGSAMAVGIFGQCLVFKAKLVGYDAAAATDLGARDVIDATGVTLVKF